MIRVTLVNRQTHIQTALTGYTNNSVTWVSLKVRPIIGQSPSLRVTLYPHHPHSPPHHLLLCGPCYWRNYIMHNTRGVQKVSSLTQLTTRYAHHILSLFNIVICNWNALGPAFRQSSDPVLEELLLSLVFQPAICPADNVLVVRKLCLFMTSFSLGKNRSHLEPGQR